MIHIVMGMVVLLLIILVALRVTVKNTIGRFIIVLLLGALLFLVGKQLAILGIVLVACELLLNFMMRKMKEDE